MSPNLYRSNFSYLRFDHRRFIHCRRFALILLLLGMVSACKTLSDAPDTSHQGAATWRADASVFTEREQQYLDTHQWRYSAKVGITAPQLRESANIIWEYADQANNVRLFGPLGVGAVRLQFDQYGVELSDNKGVLHQGHSADELLSDIIGWPIPINALSRWLFVLPTAGATYRYQLDENRNVALLEQLGWRIKYSNYKSYGEQFLPRKIVATKQLSPEQAVVVKLIAKTWH